MKMNEYERVSILLIVAVLWAVGGFVGCQTDPPPNLDKQPRDATVDSQRDTYRADSNVTSDGGSPDDGSEDSRSDTDGSSEKPNVEGFSLSGGIEPGSGRSRAEPYSLKSQIMITQSGQTSSGGGYSLDLDRVRAIEQ